MLCEKLSKYMSRAMLLLAIALAGIGGCVLGIVGMEYSLCHRPGFGYYLLHATNCVLYVVGSFLVYFVLDERVPGDPEAIVEKDCITKSWMYPAIQAFVMLLVIPFFSGALVEGPIKPEEIPVRVFWFTAIWVGIETFFLAMYFVGASERKRVYLDKRLRIAQAERENLSLRLEVSKRRTAELEAEKKVQDAKNYQWQQEQLDKRRAALQQEKERAEDEDRRRHQAERSADDHRKRENIRAECLLWYFHEFPTIGEQFSRKDFDSYISFYLNDRESPEVVEERAAMMQKTFGGLRKSAGNDPESSVLTDWATRYAKEREAIEKLPVDEEMKEAHRVQLDIRYAELSEKIVETIKP